MEMRLSDFIRQNHAPIGQAWMEHLARAFTPFMQSPDLPDLGDNLDHMLEAIADGMETPENLARSIKQTNELDTRIVEQFTNRHPRMGLPEDADYGALRTSILALYTQCAGDPAHSEIARLNEAIGTEILKSHETLMTHSVMRFLAILAHDIRNPLNVISLAAAALERQAPSSTVDRIKRGVRQVNRMVDDLAIFVRQRIGSTLPLSKAVTDLQLLCEQALENARAQHVDKSFNLSAHGDLTGMWDSDRLMQVIDNLVGNAAIHGAGQTIEIQIRHEDPAIVIEVTSQGNPIPADQLTSIFEPMVRSSSTSVSLSGGLGMGLFIVREIVAAHGGSITVKSSLEEGTTFTVRLPR